ncbi:MAG: glycerol-3-phosphate 1-O-acyltransferase PlsY [Thermosynechococcaceae cyanobacterium]
MLPMVLWSFGNGVLLLVAYLCGSLPTGYLLGKWLKGIDIRTQGSGSTGATNVLRTLGKGPGATVLLVDVLKGVAAIAFVQAAYRTGSPLLAWVPPGWTVADQLPWMVILSGLAAILGHSKSIWLNFSGGKSVATSLGIVLMLNWQVGLAMFGVFGLVLALSRIVSLSSICGAIALPILMAVFKEPLAYVLFGLVGSAYVIWRHQTNVQRLFAGTEPRLGEKTATPPNPLEPT